MAIKALQCLPISCDFMAACYYIYHGISELDIPYQGCISSEIAQSCKYARTKYAMFCEDPKTVQKGLNGQLMRLEVQGFAGDLLQRIIVISIYDN